MKIQHNFLQYFRGFQLLHFALMLVQMLLIGVIFILVNEEKSIVSIPEKNILLFAVPSAVLVIMFVAKKIYQQQLKKINQKADLKYKLHHYRTAGILQFAICEFCSLGCFIGSFLSQNLVFVYGSIGALLFFMSLRPTKFKLEKELELDFNEQNKLADPHFIVAESDHSEQID